MRSENSSSEGEKFLGTNFRIVAADNLPKSKKKKEGKKENLFLTVFISFKTPHSEAIKPVCDVHKPTEKKNPSLASRR